MLLHRSLILVILSTNPASSMWDPLNRTNGHWRRLNNVVDSSQSEIRPQTLDYNSGTTMNTNASNHIVEETKCEDDSYTKSLKRRGSAEGAIDAALKCRDGGFVTFRGRGPGIAVTKRGSRAALEVCLEIVPRVVKPEDLSTRTRLRGGSTEVLFTLRNRLRIDRSPGGFIQIIPPPAEPPWVLNTTVVGTEDHLFRIICSRDDEGQWIHFQHVKSQAYINCVHGKHIRGHGSPPGQFLAARREITTGFEFIPCLDISKGAELHAY